MATIAEQLIEKGEKRGVRDLLLRQVERRFGPVPAQVRERVEQAESADLQRWADLVLTAPTLDAVFNSST